MADIRKTGLNTADLDTAGLSTAIAELATDLRGLVLQAKRLTDERSAGAYKSAFKGQGIEFEEVREYVPGDDIRSIDWKVNARSQRPHVKSFREERELSVLIVCDLSASTGTGTKGMLRRTVVNQTASLLTLLAMQNRDRVGLVTFAGGIERFARPERKRSSHIRILIELLKSQGEKSSTATNFLDLAQFLRKVLRRKTTVFLLSDFTPNPFMKHGQEFKSELTALSKRHDIIICPVEDPTNLELPNAGLWKIVSPETGETAVVDLGVKALREKLIELEKSSRDQLFSAFRECGCDLLPLSTRGGVSQSLKSFFDRRTRVRIR